MLSTNYNERYQKEDILAFLQANYQIHSTISLGILDNYEITYATTLEDYYDIFDIAYDHDASNYLVNFFNLDILPKEVRTLLYPIHRHTIGDLCELVEQYGTKPSIKYKSVLGSECDAVSVFKYLQERLKYRNIDVSNINPSLDLVDVVKHYPELVDEILLLAPKAIPPIYKKGTFFRKKLFFEEDLKLRDVINRIDFSSINKVA